MKPRTEELLYFLAWSTNRLLRPTFRNLTDSYESWAYRTYLNRTLKNLEHSRLVQRDPTAKDQRLYRLTEQGLLHALGGRDPQAQWSRRWDGRWRLVVFDIPVNQDAQRRRLLRYLVGRGFGFLQNSVWVSPDRLDQERFILAGGKIDVGSFMVLEARPGAGETDADIVAGAWNFEAINRGYTRHQGVLEERPRGQLRSEGASSLLQRWARAERQAWLDAVGHDPLLPQRLLPPGYLGQRAWQRRTEVLREAAMQLTSFHLG